MTTRGFLKHYVSDARIVLFEYILSFLQSSEEIERHILSLDANPINKKDQYLRK